MSEKEKYVPTSKGPPKKHTLNGVRDFVDKDKVHSILDMLYKIATCSDELPEQIKDQLNLQMVKSAGEKLIDIGLKVDSGVYTGNSGPKGKRKPKESGDDGKLLKDLEDDASVVVSLKAVK